MCTISMPPRVARALLIDLNHRRLVMPVTTAACSVRFLRQDRGQVDNLLKLAGKVIERNPFQCPGELVIPLGRRNVDPGTGAAVVALLPAGLSGGSMLDTLEPINGTISIVSIFTDQDQGQARRGCRRPPGRPDEAVSPAASTSGSNERQCARFAECSNDLEGSPLRLAA